MRVTDFMENQTGAVSVDWVVLTAALTGLGLATAGVVSVGVESLSNDTADHMRQDLTMYSRFDVNRMANASFEDIEGMIAAGWGFYNANGSLMGWDNIGNLRAEVVHSGYMGIDATDGDFMLDLDASPGNMMIGQQVQGAVSGQVYTVSFDAADERGNNGVAVYWGGELVETFEPAGRSMESFSVDIVGGEGDGSNMLMIGGTGPEDNRGAFIDNIEVRS